MGMADAIIQESKGIGLSVPSNAILQDIAKIIGSLDVRPVCEYVRKWKTPCGANGKMEKAGSEIGT